DHGLGRRDSNTRPFQQAEELPRGLGRLDGEPLALVMTATVMPRSQESAGRRADAEDRSGWYPVRATDPAMHGAAPSDLAY
ncbi:MAG: hypothetical protein ACRDRL_05380, partial [Sciscionella sp.]